MASWWMPEKQLLILRRMASGEVLLHDTRRDIYYWEANKKERATPSAKALFRKMYIREDYYGREPDVARMRITPTGNNEMGYNRHRTLDKPDDSQ